MPPGLEGGPLPSSIVACQYTTSLQFSALSAHSKELLADSVVLPVSHEHPRRSFHGFARPPLWPTRATQESRPHRGRDPLARTRHRRDHLDLQHNLWRTHLSLSISKAWRDLGSINS